MSDVVSPFTHEHYRDILRAALDSGYRFISFAELAPLRDSGQQVCLLRHDCDNDLTAAANMARLEQELSVRSTYFIMLRSALYNLLSPPNTALVKEILAAGHWLGLHFDEFAIGDATPGGVAAAVNREREYLSMEFGVPVEVTSFHQPSDRVLSNEIKLSGLNTYDRVEMAKTHYLSDSNMIWREGCPSKVFASREYAMLQLLIHPEWWTVTRETADEKWCRMLRNNFTLMQESLLGREDAYKQRRAIRFDE